MTQVDYSLRAPRENDFDQWHGLWQGYLEFYQSSLAPAITDSLWQRLLDDRNPIEGRVAEASDGRLLGLVHFFPHPHTWNPQPSCYLNDLFVDPATRGGGIGEALIGVVVDTARARGWAEVYWQTQSHNSVARGLYDKITGGADGFITYSISTDG